MKRKAGEEKVTRRGRGDDQPSSGGSRRPKVLCGSSSKPGTITGSPSQCFARGVALGKRISESGSSSSTSDGSGRKKKGRTLNEASLSDSVESIAGVGARISARLDQEYGVKTLNDLLKLMRRTKEGNREAILKSIFRGFRDQSTLNKLAFKSTKDWLTNKGVQV